MQKLLKDTLYSKAGELFDNAKDPSVYVGQTSGETIPAGKVEQNNEFFVDANDPLSFIHEGGVYFFLDEVGAIQKEQYYGRPSWKGFSDQMGYVKALSAFGNLYQDVDAATAAQSGKKLAIP